jgi:hypothetical protein
MKREAVRQRQVIISCSAKPIVFHCASGGAFRAEFLRPLRGFCVSVRELNDALLWLTIEGTPGKIEVQVWLSAFGLPQSAVEGFANNWEARLKQIF